MLIGRDRLEAYPPVALALLERCPVSAFVFLIIGLVCAIISRILLFIAALGVSIWWALGVFLPFGPSLFRLNYPDLARSSMIFRFATLPCFFFYLVIGPGSAYQHHFSQVIELNSAQPVHYGLEVRGRSRKGKNSAGPIVETAPSLEERRAENFREFQRLNAWSEDLKLRKRDLLRSDDEGNRAYNLELAQYNAALEKAKAERSAIVTLPK
jgi:hypothetical protein